jgi:tetratricopeptide (TPR) repeat protein
MIGTFSFKSTSRDQARSAEMRSQGKGITLRGVTISILFAGCWALSSSLSAQQNSSSASVVERSERLRSEHRGQAAVTLLQNYLTTHAEDLGALLSLAKIRTGNHEYPAAEELLWRALNTNPNSTRANLMLGQILLEERHDPEAMDRFETVLAIDLHNAEARHGELTAVTGLAEQMRREGHPEIALKALEHARATLPDDPQLLLELGIQATELGATAEALDALAVARKLQPQDVMILYALAHAQFVAQHMADAEASFRAYLQIKPRDATAHFGLGRVLEVMQRPEEARAEFERSIKLQPVQTESYYELGDLEIKAGHYSDAERLLSKTLARDPHHGGALTDMGEICFRRKEYAQAENWLEQAVSAAPEYAQAHYYRGLVMAKLGHKDEAEQELRQATALDRKQQGPPVADTASAR